MEKHSENLAVYGKKKKRMHLLNGKSFKSVKKCTAEKPHSLLAVKLAQQKNITWQEINPPC